MIEFLNTFAPASENAETSLSTLPLAQRASAAAMQDAAAVSTPVATDACRVSVNVSMNNNMDNVLSQWMRNMLYQDGEQPEEMEW